MEGLLKYKFVTFDNPTWSDLAILCKALPKNEPCLFYAKGMINGEHGSTAGNYGIMANRDGYWQTIVVLNTMSTLDIRTDGSSIIEKTKLRTWQYTEDVNSAHSLYFISVDSKLNVYCKSIGATLSGGLSIWCDDNYIYFRRGYGTAQPAGFINTCGIPIEVANNINLPTSGVDSVTIS